MARSKRQGSTGSHVVSRSQTRQSSPKAPLIMAGAGVALVIIVMVVVLVSKAGSLPSSGDIGNAELERLIDRGVRVIDVRTTGEFEAGHIPGAENVPVDEVASAAASWDRDEPIALYCATGERSAYAMRVLTAAGFTHVYNLARGIIAWDGEVTAGLQVASGEPAPSASGLPVMYEFFTDW